MFSACSLNYSIRLQICRAHLGTFSHGFCGHIVDGLRLEVALWEHVYFFARIMLRIMFGLAAALTMMRVETVDNSR